MIDLSIAQTVGNVMIMFIGGVFVIVLCFTIAGMILNAINRVLKAIFLE